MEFLIANFAPIMFVGLICFLLFGFPVAFAVCAIFPFAAIPLVPVHADPLSPGAQAEQRARRAE